MNNHLRAMMIFKVILSIIIFGLLNGCSWQDKSVAPSVTEPVSKETSFITPALPSVIAFETATGQDCVEGYVLGGGDTTPEGLLDAPRVFLYEVLRADNSLVNITYTALPPSPSGDAKLLTLTFHAGSILIGDYVEACGKSDSVDNTLTIKESGNYIKTFPTTTVMMVRHTETASGAVNSNLSSTGLARAEVLAELAVDAGVQTIFAIDYCRTVQTALPAAENLLLPIQAQLSGNPSAGLEMCIPAIDVQIDVLPVDMNIAQEILANYSGKTVLVVGHSNTVPDLVQRLGGGELCPSFFQFSSSRTCEIPANEYDNLIIVRIPSTTDASHISVEKYGVSDIP